MSTAAVSSTSIFQELQSFYQNRQTDVQQLGNALQSGNLTGAQQAYTTLAQLGEDGPFANSEPFSQSGRTQAFNAVGEALQAGDLARAQTAFATLTGNQSTTGAAVTPASIVNLSGTQPAASASASTSASTTGSTSSIFQQIQAYRQQKQADVAQLGQDLAAGNTNAAEQDFTTLTTLGQSGQNANGQVFQNSTRAQDFQAIGQALQAGDLAGAQSDFANLASTSSTFPVSPAVGPASVVQPVTPIGQPVVAPTSTGSGIDEIIINLGSPSGTNSSTTSTTPEIVINLGQSSGSSSPLEDITINLGGAANTNASSSSGSTSTTTAPEIVLNLGQSSGAPPSAPEEITINLGSASSTNPSSLSGSTTTGTTTGTTSTPPRDRTQPGPR